MSPGQVEEERMTGMKESKTKGEEGLSKGRKEKKKRENGRE